MLIGLINNTIKCFDLLTLYSSYSLYFCLNMIFFVLTILNSGFAEEADTEIQPEIQARAMET